MKPAMVAKLAIQCSDLYADAVKLLQLESIKSLWPKVSSVNFMLHVYNICKVSSYIVACEIMNQVVAMYVLKEIHWSRSRCMWAWV